MVEITIEKLETLIEAEVRLNILKGIMAEEKYLSTKEIKTILGMEEKEDGI